MRTLWPVLLLACDSTSPTTDDVGNPDASSPDAALGCRCGSEALQWVVIDDLDFGEFFDFDTSWGTEICWIEAVCDGVAHLGVDAVLVPGESNRPIEGDQRKDPTLALTREVHCYPGHHGGDAEIAVAVSLGYLGRLAVRFDTGRPCGLVGCQIQVAEAPSYLPEFGGDIYTLAVCDAPQDGHCLLTSAGRMPLRGPLGQYPPLEVDCCACGPDGPFRRPDGQGPDAHGAP